MQPISCNFKAEHVILQMRKMCIIQNQMLSSENIELQFNKKRVRKDDGNTTALGIKECAINVWPNFDEIHNLLPSLVSLTIKQCNLRKFEKDNLSGLHFLKELIVTGNNIMCLPWDLFIHTPNIEIVCLKRNGIKFIDYNFLEPLRNVKYCDLSENTNINSKYDGLKSQNKLGLVAFKADIKAKCSISVPDLLKEIESGKLGRYRSRGSESDTDNRKLQAQQKEIESLRAQVRHWMNLCTDFTITVDEMDFKVHKSIIIDASPLLKKMIEQNPDADSLILHDISTSTFQTLLIFMYEKKLADEGINLELYSASRKLEMMDMAKMTVNSIKRTINKENAYDCLMLSNKYDDDELRTASFKEFKKNFPNKKLADEIAKQPETLKKIMKAKLVMDEAFQALEISDPLKPTTSW